jgi:alpha-L-fucosidase
MKRTICIMVLFAFPVLIFSSTAYSGDQDMEGQYQPTKKSLSRHPVPEWYHDAKFGIFIHWSLSSVPGFAPVDRGSIWEIVAQHGWEEHYKYNPYAEWYLNTMKIQGSPTRKYHMENYGPDYSYYKFADEFNRDIQKWDPEAWADLFREVGARYVVLVTKHHDGFLLWPSSRPNPIISDYQAKRDLVGELTSAVKDRGLRMGFYYSGALDWTFNQEPIRDMASSLTNGPVSREYAEYVEYHWRELIDRYEPSIIWNDIGYPPAGDPLEIIAYFYNKTPEGVVNDRWTQIPKKARKVLASWPLKNIIDWVSVQVVSRQSLSLQKPAYCDFTTPEYSTLAKVSEHKWECVRGVGHSFGYNRIETEEHYMDAPEAVRMLVDIVSKNGNLLLNIGPRSDGSIPEEQLECIRGIGKWLDINGQAIYGTRPWIHAEGKTETGMDIRFTKKHHALYAILLDTPKGSEIIIRNLRVNNNSEVYLLGNDSTLRWTQQGPDIKICLPEEIPESPAHVIKICPLPDRA